MSIPASLIPGMDPSAIGQAGKRSRRGKRSAAEGKAWERELEWTHKGYLECGVAMIDKVPVPTVPVMIGQGKAKRMFRRFSERTACDYIGCVAVPPFNGRTAMMEAKHTAKEAPSLVVVLRGSGSGLQFHQLAALHRVRKFGGYGCVVWKNGDQRLILLPDQITVWHAQALRMVSIGRKSMKIPVRVFESFERQELRNMDSGAPWGDAENWLLPLTRWVKANTVAASVAGKVE